MGAGARSKGNLPVQTKALIGRGEELERVQETCRRARLVTLAGVGGVGKTRLALQAATALQPEFADGAWLVELSPLQDGRLLPHMIGQALPLASDHTDRSMIDVLAEYFADREMLLVWDTCEHLTDACAMTAQALLLAASGLRILTTSRRSLGVPGEQLLIVDPLPVPEGGGSAAVEADAVTLLADRAAEALPGFAVTDANRAEVLRLCRRLEGVPLAIELAAARLPEMPVAELTARLEDRFAVLGTTEEAVHGAAPPWHQALHTAIGWSHQLCTPAERLLWARLSVFAGSFDAQAARQVCSDVHLPQRTIPELLGRLADMSILTWLPTGGGERYRMLDTLREYGAYWLRILGEQQQSRRCHQDFYLRLARSGDKAWLGSEQFPWSDRVRSEHDNLRAALEFCFAESEGRTALELAGALWFLWYPCGFPKEGQYYLQRALALDTRPSRARNKALWACALAALIQGDVDTGTALAEECTAGAERLGDTDAIADALTATLTAAWMRGDLNGVMSAAETLRAQQNGGELTISALCMHTALAYVHTARGRLAEAIAELDELRALCARHGEQWARANGDFLRANIELARGRPEAAWAHARASLGTRHRLHDRLGLATCLDVLARAAAACGHAERAAQLLGLAHQVWGTIGRPQAGNPLRIAARRACEQQVRHTLGERAFETAFRAGRNTDLDTGIAHIRLDDSQGRTGKRGAG